MANYVTFRLCYSLTPTIKNVECNSETPALGWLSSSEAIWKSLSHFMHTVSPQL